MPVFNLSRYANALKTKYGDAVDLWYPESCPFGARVKKNYNRRGDGWTVHPIIDHPSGNTNILSALADDAPPTPLRFTITRVEEFITMKVNNHALEAAKDGGAVEEITEVAMRSMMRGFGKATTHQIWGNGGGARGQVESASTSSVVLTDVEDIVHFVKGMVIQGSADDGVSASAGVYPAQQLVVSATNPDTRTVTFTTTLASSAPSITTNSFLFRKNDYQNVLKGVFAWLPDTVTSTSFFGVDRTQYTNGLAGHRTSSSGSNVEASLIDAIQRGKLLGGKFDTVFMGTRRYGELLKSLQSKSWVTIPTSKPTLSFKGVEFATSAGMVTVQDDWGLRDDKSLITRMDSWELGAAGKIPQFEEGDGRRWRVEVAGDAIQCRAKCYWQLTCESPIDSIVHTWTS